MLQINELSIWHSRNHYFHRVCVWKTPINVILFCRNRALTNDFCSTYCCGERTEGVKIKSIYKYNRFSTILGQASNLIFKTPRLCWSVRLLKIIKKFNDRDSNKRKQFQIIKKFIDRDGNELRSWVTQLRYLVTRKWNFKNR